MNWRFWKKKEEVPSPKDMAIIALLEKLVDSTLLGTETAIGYFNYVLKAQKEGYPIEDFERRAKVHEKLIAQHFEHFLRAVVSISVLSSGNISEYLHRLPDSSFSIAAYLHKEHRGGIEALMAKIRTD